MMRRAFAAVAAMMVLVGVVARPGFATAESLSDEQYEAIQNAFLGEQFDMVTQIVKPLLPIDATPATLRIPGDAGLARAWLWYALSLERLQRMGEALHEIDRLKLSLPGAQQTGTEILWPEVLFWEGEISRKSLQMVRARLAYNRLLTSFPRSSWCAQARLGLAFVLFHQQSYDAAMQELSTVMTTTPSSTVMRQARILEGLCELQLKRFDAAAARFAQLYTDTDQPELRAQMAFYQGEALSGQQRFDAAIDAYNSAEQAAPGSQWARLAHFGIGWSEFQQHQYREALAILDPSKKADSTWPLAELLYAQGRCLLEMHDERGALAHFEQLRGTFPDHPLTLEAAVFMAELLEHEQRFADASSTLEALIRAPVAVDQQEQARLRLGSICLSQGQTEQALAQFRAVEQSKLPEFRQVAWNGEGDAQASLGDVEHAKRAYQESLKINRATDAGRYAQYQLARLKLQAGERKDALDTLQDLATGGALAFDARLALAYAALSIGERDRAVTQLQQARALAPSPEQAARLGYYEALAAAGDGRVDDARKACEQTLHDAPASDEAFEARLLLADLEAASGSPGDAVALLTKALGPERIAKVPVAMAPARGQTASTAPVKPEPAALSGRQRGRVVKKLGDLSRQSGRYAEAIRRYEQSWDALPDDRGEIDYLLGSCYEEAGDVAVAIGRYQHIGQAPWTIRGQLAAAKLLERDERYDEAIRIYHGVMTQPIPEAKIAEERLASLSAQARPR